MKFTVRPEVAKASAVAGQTAAIFTSLKIFEGESSNSAQRCWTARKAFWLVKKTQSNRTEFLRHASSSARLSAGANATSGSKIGSAPESRRASTSDWLCSSARVTTTRLPASGLWFISATGALHLFENRSRAAFSENARKMFAKLRGLIGRRGGLLADVLGAVDGTNNGFHHEFTALHSDPSANRHLAATLQSGKQSAFGDDRGTRFHVVQLGQKFVGVAIAHTGLDGDGALPDRGQRNIGRNRFSDFLAPAEAVEACFRKDDGVVFATFHFAEPHVHIAAKFAKVEIWAIVPQLSLSAQAARADSGALLQIR